MIDELRAHGATVNNLIHRIVAAAQGKRDIPLIEKKGNRTYHLSLEGPDGAQLPKLTLTGNKFDIEYVFLNGEGDFRVSFGGALQMTTTDASPDSSIMTNASEVLRTGIPHLEEILATLAA